jgi:LmbE family N-acetylglucosaminyl deacetylase
MLRLMCITAHPDDEAGSFGGSLRLYHDRGVETCVVCLTPGQAATHRGGAASDQDLAAARRKEFAAACEILKVTRGLVLDYPDGQLHRQDLYKVVCDLTLHVRRFRPHVLLTFGPDGSITGHTDHSMASVLATLAFHWGDAPTVFPIKSQAKLLPTELRSSTTAPRTSLCPTANRSRCLQPPQSSKSAIIWKPRSPRSRLTPARRLCGRSSSLMFACVGGRRCSIWLPG